MAMALPTPFDVTATERDDLATVAVMGELDCDTAPRLNQVLASLADRDRVILVDLSQTEFMDCAGIAPLVAAYRLQREVGGDLVLDSPGRAVFRVIELTQLDKLINVVGNTASSQSRVLGGHRAETP
jgi:anti-sigma B factor antagonist